MLARHLLKVRNFVEIFLLVQGELPLGELPPGELPPGNWPPGELPPSKLPLCELPTVNCYHMLLGGFPLEISHLENCILSSDRFIQIKRRLFYMGNLQILVLITIASRLANCVSQVYMCLASLFFTN